MSADPTGMYTVVLGDGVRRGQPDPINDPFYPEGMTRPKAKTRFALLPIGHAELVTQNWSGHAELVTQTGSLPSLR